jgi:hypothetical protein
MPKGDGTTYALDASLKVYYRYYPNMVENEIFKDEISMELGLGDGRDGPFLIKKSETARYFNLISYDFDSRQGYITEAGIAYLHAVNWETRHDIIFNSIMNNTFGRWNCASKTSDSDLDPPKLLLKAMSELGGITKQQFSRLIYLINDLNYSFESIIENLYLMNDTLPPLLVNKYNDIKFLVFLKNIGMIIQIEGKLQLNQEYFDSQKLKKIEETSIYNNIPIGGFEALESEEDINEAIAVYNPRVLEAINNRAPESFLTSQVIKYKTNPRIKKTAIKNTNYKCEHDMFHSTFLDRKGNLYMEGHHLIPMNAQSNTSINLDRVENIVSLCPTCHRAVHYGNKTVKREILWTLYQNNIQSLANVGLNIPFDKLLSYY